MAIAASETGIPWWKEPTKDQWYAYLAAWLGWAGVARRTYTRMMRDLAARYRIALV